MERPVKIAITASGNNLDADLDRRFPGARYVLIVHSTGTLIEAVDNVEEMSAHDPRGSKLCHLLAKKRVDFVITGLCMSGFSETLAHDGISVVETPSRTVREALRHFKAMRGLVK